MKIQHGYLYLADLNPSRGTEAGKTRPVLVMQTNYLNEADHPSTWVLPVTSKISDQNLIRTFVPKKVAGNDVDCEVMIDQSRSIDNKRFKQELGPLPFLLLKYVKAKLRLLGEL
jgi:mRNA interferase MazF